MNPGRLVAALALTMVLACDDPDQAPLSASPTADPAPASAVLTLAPIQSSISSPTAIAAVAEPASTFTLPGLPNDPSLNGFVAIDPVSGGVTPIWLGKEPMWDVDVYPGLTPGRDGVWLSWRGVAKESVRFGVDGTKGDRVPGVWSDESPDGSVVLYYTTASDNRRHLVVQYADRTVDLGASCCAVARDDGRVVFLGPFEKNEGRSLAVYDPTTDDTWTIAVGVVRPGKEGVVYPTWSPSGRFISDYSYSEPGLRPAYWILADTETREVRTSTSPWFWQRGPGGEDWLGEAIDGDLVYGDAATGAEVLRLSVPDEMIAHGRDLGGVVEATTRTADRTRIGRVVFDLAGNELRRWEGNWDLAMTPDGPAAARVAQFDCQAIEVQHPRFEANLPCAASKLEWSPDGRFLAYHTEGKPTSEICIVELTTGNTRTYETKHGAFAIEWNHDGSRLVVRLGGGI